jgi:glycosyltransferase involved in cell wall biosynthesis
MKPRIAVVHPMLLPGGGSEACAMWTAQTLAEEGDVTLITMGRPDLAALNRSSGTDLGPGRIAVLSLAVPPGMRKRFDALRAFRLERYCRRHARDFDVMISAYNAMDFGAAGIQIVTDFSFDDGLRRELCAAGGGSGGRLYRASAARSLYLGLGRALAGRTPDGWKRNRTVACSAWIQGLLKERFGVPSEVIYPPVTGAAPSTPWEEREEGFVVMGRLVPEKGFGSVVDILARVRRDRPVHLHVIGRRGRAAYARELEALRRRHGDWIHLEGELYGRDKEALLARHRFGISGCRNESFGIAVAEMVKAGEVVWVPDGGGQTEIVAHSGLVYGGPDDAAALILAALAGPERMADLRRHLERRAALFSPGRFAGGIRTLVLDFLREARADAA